MSAAPENRWRRQSERPSSNTAGQQSGPRRDSAAQSSQTPSAVPPQVNVWAAGDRSRSGSGARPGNGPRAGTPGNTSSTAGPPGEAHVSVKEFNAAEIKDFLKQNYQKAIAGDGGKKALYKPQGDTPGAKPSGPWGSKPTVMANGQDFWVQLTKQIAAKEAGG